MFQTGSRLLIGAAVAGRRSAPIVYGVTQGGSLGTIGLVFAAAALALLAGVNLWARDSDVSAMDPTARTQSPAAAPPPGASMWPIVGAARRGAARRRARHATRWSSSSGSSPCSPPRPSGWCRPGASGPRPTPGSTRASAPASPTRSSSRCSPPSASAIIVYSFSRIMLFLSKSAAPAVFAFIAALILAWAGSSSPSGPSLRAGAIAAVVRHRRPRAWSPAEPSPPSRASGSCTRTRRPATSPCSASATDRGDRGRRERLAVGGGQGQPRRPSRSSSEDGTLVADNARRRPATRTVLVVTRANPTNVLFVNDSGEDAPVVRSTSAPKPEVDADGSADRGHGGAVPVLHGPRRGRRLGSS